ncbi:rhodanese-like domain-containing protein [Polycladidibacter hongkongensis]|uniref:rhodanese-like domain-containing protein n=1 Tax=Polycladidibacter hongkongensis TaxID=1647556 RepID=UPI0031343493
MQIEMDAVVQTYAGDVSVEVAYAALGADDKAVLVDVRTEAEWTFVGVPDLSVFDKQTILIEWQQFPSSLLNEGFAEQLSSLLAQKGLDERTPIYFLCRSGARSRNAAVAMTAHGYQSCFNIQEGFEGPLDEVGHRGGISGWKTSGFPWRQS